MTFGEILQGFLQNLVTWGANVGVKIVIALVLLFVSFKLINWIGKRILKRGEEKDADKTILRTAVYVLKIVAKVIVGVCLVGYLGIDTSGITALIASLGVCVGLAVNGALSNLAGGVLIILSRPFRVDDFIEAQGVSGTVEAIHLTHTVIVTPDNKVVHVPNGALSSGNVINYSTKDVRRVDFDFSIAYSSDFDAAKEIVLGILSADARVLSEPAAPFVKMGAHGASEIVVKARVWAKSGDYWGIYFDTLEAVKKAFDEKGIEIPYQQLDVHIKNQ